jgi:G3E family GTPase
MFEIERLNAFDAFNLSSIYRSNFNLSFVVVIFDNKCFIQILIMPILQTQIEVSKNDLLRGVEQLNTTDLEDFIHQILQINAKRKAVKTNKKEGELLLIINHNFNETEQTRFDELIEKRQSHTITEEELEELKSLSDYSEEIAVERVKALTELAALRGTTVRELMKSLELSPRNYE